MQRPRHLFSQVASGQGATAIVASSDLRRRLGLESRCAYRVCANEVSHALLPGSRPRPERFFCEIALSNTLQGADELLALVEKHGLVAALGINNPCHAVMRQAKAWLGEERLGAPLTYQMAFGNYLPNWHPWEPYQDFYDETQILGVIAQELGKLYTLLGSPMRKLYAQSRHPDALQIEGPDNLQILARTAAGYTFEQAYIDEFGLFLDALDSRREWYHPLHDGVQILHLLDAVKESSATGQRVVISE
ncbi:MAG: hypothetical protein OXI78_03780 [Anaerolineaceae bacterium]|nr:hypothetical protein [Anaerolineaceae bacterium]